MKLSAGAVKKLAIVAVIAAVVAAFFIFNLNDYLSLSYIKESRDGFQRVYAQNPVTVIAVYMGVYILVTALSLPGALVMSLAGGAVFGLLAGTVIVSFSSTIGATLAFLAARFLLRDWVQARIGKRLFAINQGVEREGAFYLFSLRLVPLFPFWLINLAMGLTPMRWTTFYWVSQVGMLPGTIVFINAGKELGKLDSLSGILSPGLILSFVILGLFPLVTKKLLNLYVRKKKGREPGEIAGDGEGEAS